MIFCFGGWGDNEKKIHWGMLKKEGIPHHNFYDPRHIWYQESIDEIFETIKELSDGHGMDRFLGVSMGGYGALMFSSLAGTGPALALSPQTTLLHPERTAEAKHHNLKKMKGKSPYPNLSLLTYPEGTTILYPDKNKHDRFHAELMKDCVRLVGIDSNKHGWFRDAPKEEFRESVFNWIETKNWG